MSDVDGRGSGSSVANPHFWPDSGAGLGSSHPVRAHGELTSRAVDNGRGGQAGLTRLNAALMCGLVGRLELVVTPISPIHFVVCLYLYMATFKQ